MSGPGGSWVGVITLFPELVTDVAGAGVLGRAIEQGIIDLSVFNPRDFARDRHRTVDDRPYGGGPGMVMMVQPLLDALDAARAEAATRGVGARVIYLTPQGERLDQRKVQELAGRDGVILLCGRYEGVDERLLAAEVDEHLSIGDYVLTGGELPALVVMDAVSRHLPGTLGNSASAMEESHLDGLLDYPHYTRPENSARGVVPPVLMSGDHAVVQRFRKREALKRTWMHRPDLLSSRPLTEVETTLLTELFESELRSGAEFSN